MERTDIAAGAVGELDEEFVHHLSRGTDLLAAGDHAGARVSLKRAADLRPREGKVLGLLGQGCYRAGLLDEAIDAYGALVADSPAELVARVNLGLALLKAQRYAEAIRHLSVAVDLAPDHRKAMGYLGFAHLESGSPAVARAWFERAGSAAMVARCDEVIARAGAPEGAGGTAGAKAAAVEAARPEVTKPEGTPATDESAKPAVEVPGAAAVPVQVDAGDGLDAFAERRTLRPGRDGFVVEGGVLQVPLRGEVLARMEGLIAARGVATVRPEVKRFRGQPTDKPFGVGRERMHRFSGEGTLLFRTAGWVLTAVDLARDAGYFREEPIFALEKEIDYENGRVPSRHSRDLDLVHVRGNGRILLRTAAPPVALEVTGAAPVRVPLAALVGWTGTVTPQVELLGSVGLVDGPGLLVAHLTGEGRVLVDPEAGLGE